MLERCDKAYYDVAVLSTKNTGNIQKLAENGKVKVAVVSAFVFDTPSARANLENMINRGVRVVPLDENAVFSHKNMQIKFCNMPMTGNEKAVVEINCYGKTFVSAQTLARKETELLMNEDVFINCDYFKIAGSSLYDEKSLSILTNGKVLKNEKNLTVNLS